MFICFVGRLRIDRESFRSLHIWTIKYFIMLPIIPPLNAQSPKDAIVNFHEALVFLGHQPNPAEIKNKEYSDSTRKIVMTIQRLFRLNETDGFVGEQTAKQLNQLLKDK